jgi:flagellar basal-body rod protein FlgC
MDLLTAIKISASGLNAQRTRLNVLSSNLANANSTRSADGEGPFKRKNPIFEEISLGSFEKHLDKAAKNLSVVRVREVVEDATPGERIYDPSHPDADTSGYVTLSNVKVVQELTDIMATSSAYEANITAIKSAKDMINAALSIGREG